MPRQGSGINLVADNFQSIRLAYKRPEFESIHFRPDIVAVNHPATRAD